MAVKKVCFVASLLAMTLFQHTLRENKDLNTENYREQIEQAILQSVHELPEGLAERLGTVDSKPFQKRAEELIAQINQEDDAKKIAELQIELIYQPIALISRIQNGGSKGFTPAVAREVSGMDCSLSAWSLKEKLQNDNVQNIDFQFGYPLGHAVGIIQVADGRQLYVDAQNGFVYEVTLEEVKDEDQPDTAYPIYEIKNLKKITGHLPNEGEVWITRLKEGNDYIPDVLGVKPDGLTHTIGNMHMLANPQSPSFYTETGRRFRKNVGILSDMTDRQYNAMKKGIDRWERNSGDWGKLEGYLLEGVGDDRDKVHQYIQRWQDDYNEFEKFSRMVAGGKVIEETKFYERSNRHHSEWRKQKQAEKDELEVLKIKEKIGLVSA